jgi:hypothetical protein
MNEVTGYLKNMENKKGDREKHETVCHSNPVSPLGVEVEAT